MIADSHAVPNGYKQTEAGVIPYDWDVKQIGDVADFANGKPLEDSVSPQGRYSLITLDSIGIDGQLKSEHKMTTVFDDSLEENDIVAVLSDLAHGNLLGLCDVIPESNQYVLNQRMGRLRLKKAGDSRFVRLQINQRQNHFRTRGQGTSQKHIYRRDFDCLHIPFPARSEQEAIAEALGDADALIESLEQLVAKKRHLKQAAMQQLLTGKKRLPGFEVKPGYKETEIGAIPEDWEIKLLPDICRFRGGKAHEQHISDTGRFVCVNSKFISTDGQVRKYCRKNFCPANGGDVLMVMSDLPNGKALAKAFFVDQDDVYAVNQRVCALTPYRDSSGFLFYALNRHPYFLKFDDGVNQTHLLNRVFEKCPVVLPTDRDEQDVIATILTDMGEEIEAIEAKLAKARQIKQGMMQELLTGKTRLI